MQFTTILLSALTVYAGSPVPVHTGASCTRWDHGAVAVAAQGRYTEAECLLSGALGPGDRLDPVCAGLGLNNIAALLLRSGRPKEAEAMGKRSVQALEQRFSPDDLILLRPLNTLAAAELQQGQTARARETLKMMQSIRAPRPEDRALVNAAAASLFEAQGRWREAETQYGAAIQAMREAGQGDTADAGVLLLDIGGLYIKEHHLREAQLALTEALDVFDRAPDSEPSDRINLLWLRGTLHSRLREWGPAEKDLADALSIADRASQMDAAVIKPLLADYAAVLRKNHRRSGAKAVELRIDALGGDAVGHAVVDVSELLAWPNEKY